MKVRKGDTVKLLTGKDRGKTGRVVRVLPGDDRVLVEDVALQTKHRRPRKAGEKGQRISVPAPVHASNVMVVCPKCNKTSRVGYHLDTESGKKARVCKQCGATI
jgi:large subunit ribosomal protein L24